MTDLLASVRSLHEADIAIAGGCDWVDLKEPNSGALGAVSLDVMRTVVARHGGQRPISATIGDCWNTPALIPERVAAAAKTGVDYVKIGLFAPAWSLELEAAVRAAVRVMPHLIAVCFAEDPPTFDDVAKLGASGFKGVMLDTANKSQASLTTLMTTAEIADFVTSARSHRLLTGLAGSLQARDVPVLMPLGADYLGFRGALCARGRREAALEREAVVRLRRLMVSGVHRYASGRAAG